MSESIHGGHPTMDLLDEESNISSSGNASSSSSSSSEKKGYENWVTCIRIVLSLCLIYYHNHRMFDSFRHHVSIFPQMGEDADSVRTIVKTSQRLVLQAGLNLFMFLSGVASFYSFRKRRQNLLAITGERAFKLLLGFSFGCIFVIFPTRFFIHYCATEFTFSDFFKFVMPFYENFADSQHIGYLPYLFVITVLLMPMNSIALNVVQYLIKDTPSSSYDSPDTPELYSKAAPLRVPSWWILSGVIYVSLILYIDLGNFLTIIVLVLMIFRDGSAGFLRILLNNTYTVYRHPGSGKFIFIYSWIFPLFCAYIFAYILPDFGHPPLSVLIIFLPTQIVVFLGNAHRITPFPKRLPEFHINFALVSLILTAIGQLWFCAGPERVLQFNDDDEYLFFEFLTKKHIAGWVLMSFGHISFFIYGFMFMILKEHMPRVPYDSPLVIIVVSIYVILSTAFVVQPSRDFRFLTAGYASYHFRIKRFWYHFGSWSWVTIILAGSYNLASGVSFEGPGIEKSILRFLRDSTFGTFLCHPMFGFIIGCAIKDVKMNYTMKILLVDLFVYVCSFIWTRFLLQFRLLRPLFGVKW